jgi:hypothetical protein
MGAITQQPQFMDYVRRLENQNRMVKRVGFVLFLLCFSAIGLLAWKVKKLSRPTTPQGQTKIVSANEFHLMDENGKVQGMLAASSGGAMLFLNGPNDKTGLMFAPGQGGSSLSLMSSSGEQQVTLNTEDALAWVTIGTKESNGDKIQLTARSGAQNVMVSDKDGFQAVLGVSTLVTPESGETRQTSVAALTLFGKDGHVIWRTPKP